MKRILTVPNGITSLRIVGALVLIGVSPSSAVFYIIYTLCGISDALDGLVARMTGQQSEFGAKLDSLSDLLFYSVMLLKLLPMLWELLPRAIWYGVGAILVVRSLSYLVAAIRYKRFASLHTYLNKATGLVLFAVPYCLQVSFATEFCILVCVIGALASAEELFMHLIAKQYSPDTKTLWHIK